MQDFQKVMVRIQKMFANLLDLDNNGLSRRILEILTPHDFNMGNIQLIPQYKMRK